MDENAPIPHDVEVVDQETLRQADLGGHLAQRDDGAGEQGPEGQPVEAIERPAKVMRIGSMIKQLLDEVRVAPLDDASRTRLKEIFETSVHELAGTLSPDLAAELGRMAPPFSSDSPSDSELRIAQAQLIGWLEGLFHGIQATLFAQQMAARGQLEEMRAERGLPRGADPGPEDGRGGPGYL